MKIVVTALVMLAIWVGTTLYGALQGWWHAELAPAGDAAAFMRAARDYLEDRRRGNVAFVLIEHGRVFDRYFAGQGQRVDDGTVFPTASMSKWLTAYGVMSLVQSGRLDLDRPVSDYLTRWRLPEGEFDVSGVTVRRLLSHTAGLTDGLGFGDYAADERVPGLVESLRQPRASAGRGAAIALGYAPGDRWEYSGGGYLILELLIEEITGEPFDAFMSRAVFTPLGMKTSTYRYLGEVDDAAVSFDAAGKPAPWYRYAAKAATGLSGSARDLVRFVEGQVAPAAAPLTADTLASMRVPHGRALGADIWGLGTMLYAPTGSGDFIYGHDGLNAPAINAAVRINPDTTDAIIVLVTGGPALATMLGFEWVFWQTGLPDFLGIGAVVSEALPMMMIGGIAIIVVATVAWWRRRAAA